jgi:hypothetical protein
MFIRLSAIFSIFDRSGYNSENSTLSTLEQNLRSHSSYIGSVPSRRFSWEETVEVPRYDDQETMVKVRKTRCTSTSAIIVDYDKFKEMYNIDFRRTALVQEEQKSDSTPATEDVKHPATDPGLPFQPVDDKPF